MDEITKMTPDTGKRETIKTPFAKIIVGGTVEKPYYMICYYDTADRQFVVCCGSYNRDFVFQWYREDFEIIDNGGFDAVPVVRCRECKHHRVLLGRDMCAKNAVIIGGSEVGLKATGANDFCSYGEREDRQCD